MRVKLLIIFFLRSSGRNNKLVQTTREREIERVNERSNKREMYLTEKKKNEQQQQQQNENIKWDIAQAHDFAYY